MSRDKEQQFISGIKSGLDKSLHELDAVTLARLQAARLTALEHAEHKSVWLSRNKMLLATAMSTLLAVSVWFIQKPGNGSLPMDDLPLLTATEDFELYRKLEFYQWLEYETEQG